MAMRVEATVPAFGRDVTVRELTVGEIRAWFASIENRSADGLDMVDLALFDELELSDFKVLTDLAPDEIEKARPSELRAVMGKCREVNNDFFVLRGKLLKAGLQVLQSSAAP